MSGVRWDWWGEETGGQETEIRFQVGSVCVFCVTKLFQLSTLGFCTVLWHVLHFDVIMMDHVGGGGKQVEVGGNMRRWVKAGGRIGGFIGGG